MVIDASSVYDVVSGEAVESLGDDLLSVGETVLNAMHEAGDAWAVLPNYFEVSGAEGVYQMLYQPTVDAANLYRAVDAAQRECRSHASTFTTLEADRATLLDRIETSNAGVRSASEALDEARYMGGVCYSPDTPEGRLQQQTLQDAQWGFGLAQAVEDRLRDDIEKFNKRVSDTEHDLAAALRSIEAGTDVHYPNGNPTSREVTQWGEYSRAGKSSMSDLELVKKFQEALTTGIEQRLKLLGEMSSGELEAWALANPAFIAAVGLALPDRMRAWYDKMLKDPARSNLFWEAAPGVIGNMNGIPSTAKDEYNRRYLDQLLSDPNLSDEHRDHLQNVYRAIWDDSGDPIQDAALLTLFLDTSDSNEPRAAVAYGDVDTADLVITMTHGINTNLEDFGDWTDTASGLRADLEKELDRRGYHADDGRNRVATVAWFGYDSKGTGSVWGVGHADAGAMRYSQFMTGLSYTNAEAVTSGWFHSYGTTMGAEAMARTPGMLDQAYTLGSAGWTQEAADAIGKQKNLEVNSTHADRDWTAEWGRKPWLSSHAVNPIDLGYTNTISSEQGDVDYGVGENGDHKIVENARQTEGHGAHTHFPWYEPEYQLYDEQIPGGEAGYWAPREQLGYLEPESRAYHAGVDEAADLLAETK